MKCLVAKIDNELVLDFSLRPLAEWGFRSQQCLVT